MLNKRGPLLCFNEKTRARLHHVSRQEMKIDGSVEIRCWPPTVKNTGTRRLDKSGRSKMAVFYHSIRWMIQSSAKWTVLDLTINMNEAKWKWTVLYSNICIIFMKVFSPRERSWWYWWSRDPLAKKCSSMASYHQKSGPKIWQTFRRQWSRHSLSCK